MLVIPDGPAFLYYYHIIPIITGFFMRQAAYSDEESEQLHYYNHASFDLSNMQMKIKTLTHDYYILELPHDRHNSFYRQFPFYLDELDFRGNPIQIASVARIYGTNQFGQKCCCHIHGYFSHFYIKANEFSVAFSQDREFVFNFLSMLEGLYQRAYSINKPIIINAVAEKKVDFYGYHEKQETFLKITVYDPAYVPKLRELLDSQIVGGRIFQCYEAHISYFMQLFADNNIYGINELNIMDFTFRKNLTSPMMDLFRKINTQTSHLFSQGYDLVQIEKKCPDLFNTLQKISSCYIQIDLSISGILNSYSPEHEIINSNDQMSMDSEMDIEDFNLGDQRLKFDVKITRALKEIWQDEKKRRKIYGIKEMPEAIIDYSKNIQSKSKPGDQKDPLWVNFIKKTNNSATFIEMIKSSLRGEVRRQSNKIEVCREVAQNYKQVLSGQREKLIEKVMGRWKYYGSRKQNILQQILNGQREELPEWEDDRNNQQDSSESSDKEDNDAEGEQGQVNQTRSQAPKLKLSNTALYRNNYKHVKATLKKGSYFYVCSYCKNISVNCKCQDTKNSVQSTQESLNQDVQSIYFKEEAEKIRIKYKEQPPSVNQVLEDAIVKNQRPFYSNFKDLFAYHKINPIFEPSLKNAQILDRELKTIKDYNREPITIKNQLKLPYYFKVVFTSDHQSKPLKQMAYRVKYMVDPPSPNEVFQQVIKKPQLPSHNRRSTSIRSSKDDTFVSDLVILHYEFLVGFENNCQRFCADPQKDEIICISLQTRNFKDYRRVFKSLILVQKFVHKESLQIWQYDDIHFVKNQYDLLSMLISIICRLDPDLLVSYDQEKRGIRYLTQRGFAYGINFQQLISRSCELDELFEFLNFNQFKAVKSMFLTKQALLNGNILQHKSKDKKLNPQIAYLQAKLKQSLKRKPVLRQKYKFDIEVKGRVNVSLYRICQQQLKLESYTIQNICKHLFSEQVAQFTDKDLFDFYTKPIEGSGEQTTEQGINFVLGYLSKRLELQAEIIVNMNIVSVLVEKSKIYGSDIVSMMERGSQFKIEAIMCRVTKKLGYITLSASKRQVGNQSVLQCIPLVLEPPKQFFTDPVLLFDFQSLYPSIMIAYNICYSTCLGSIHNLFDKEKLKRLGVSEKTNVDVRFLEEILKMCDEQEAKKKIQSSIFLTPNKVAFVKKSVREGVIPRILLQFLMTRIMIKNSEGLYKKAKIKKILKDRQYALKLFMNVMFGYTGASFTGRMPCSQIADSIVQLAKYSLRQAIDYLNSHPKYKGKVLYGDTDSIFFHMPGFKVNDAIKIGRQLALEITAMFPYPIEMKFEKVYDGLFLVAKKRYYGKMYQSENSAPKYEGKGLECIRRDGINLTRNLMRKMLDTLIDTRDLSVLKQIFREESAQILNNQKLESQFTLAKEVKLLKYGDKTCPGHGQAAKRLQKIDPMMVPKYGQRMKYVVINGGLKSIKSRSMPMFEYLSNKTMSLDLDYYFRKQVLPPIQRVLSSLADLNEWSASIQYRHSFQFSQAHQLQVNKRCLHCHGETYFILCQKCFDYADSQISKINELNEQAINVCSDCTGCRPIAQVNKCIEWNCKQLWSRRNAQKMRKNIYGELSKLKDAIEQLKL